MLHAELWREGVQHSSFEALNDVVVSKGDIARMGEFAVELDGKSVPDSARRRHRLHAHRLDGLYAGRQRTDSHTRCRRAGGHAHLPHLLTLRPIVVRAMPPSPSGRRCSNTALLTVDGSMRLNCCAAMSSAAIVLSTLSAGAPERGSFFEALRSKLSWGER